MRDGTLAAIVFDFDGLIVDTETPGFISWQEVYQEFGTALEIDDWRACDRIRRRIRSRDSPGALTRPQARLVADHPEARSPKLGIDSTGEHPAGDRSAYAKRQGTPVTCVGVASNSGNGWVEGGLQRLGLRGYVDAVVTRDMVINPKPAPDIYLKTVQTLSVEPHFAVALEDSEPGCRAAKQAGLKAVAIPNRFSERQDLTVANLVVRSAEELDLDRLVALAAS